MIHIITFEWNTVCEWGKKQKKAKPKCSFLLSQTSQIVKNVIYLGYFYLKGNFVCFGFRECRWVGTGVWWECGGVVHVCYKLKYRLKRTNGYVGTTFRTDFILDGW